MSAIAEVSDLRVLTVSELLQPLTTRDLTELGEHEMPQVKYWKPTTAGELHCNTWD